MNTNSSAKSVHRVLDLLDDVRQVTNGWTALCPAHDDRRPSLSVAEGDDGRILVHCFVGCDPEQIVQAIGLQLSDLFPEKSVAKPKSGAGLTLEAYVRAKGLSQSLVQQLGITQIHIDGTPALRIPYKDRAGDEVSVRIRLGLDGDNRFRWKTGSKAFPYGVWRLAKYSGDYICVVEGESDAQTLWLNRFPAIGLPGAVTWQEAWAKYLDRFQKIYVLIEPDQGGEAVKRWLGQSNIRNRVRLIKLDGYKDASELYLANPDGFSSAWKRAMSAATPWREIEDDDKKAKRKEAWAKCKNLATSDDILGSFQRTLRQLGVAGERRTASIVYLAVTSRLLPRPVSLSLAGQSSAGKSFLVEKVLAFFPQDAFYAVTAMSERALAYWNEPLVHRMLVIYEATALRSDFTNYILRSLLSEGHLRYATVEKTTEGFRPRVIERPGPTGLLMTTTALKLHPENATRLFSLPVTDTPSQTRRVMRAIAAKHAGREGSQNFAPDLDEWRALQTWLSYKNNTVVVPFAGALSELMQPVAVRLRRDFSAILTLIEAHAILHQQTRKRDDDERVVATLADYEAVRELVNDLVSEGLEQTTSQTIRETVNAVAEICNGCSDDGGSGVSDRNGATILQVANNLRLDRSAASRRIKMALTRGYIKNLETNRYRPMRLVLDDPLPDDEQVMPTVEEVRERWKTMG